MQCIQSISLKNELDTLDCFEKYFRIWNFLGNDFENHFEYSFEHLKFRGKFWILGQLYTTNCILHYYYFYYD